MIDDLTDSEIEKIVDLTYSIIEVVSAFIRYDSDFDDDSDDDSATFAA